MSDFGAPARSSATARFPRLVRETPEGRWLIEREKERLRLWCQREEVPWFPVGGEPEGREEDL